MKSIKKTINITVYMPISIALCFGCCWLYFMQPKMKEEPTALLENSWLINVHGNISSVINRYLISDTVLTNANVLFVMPIRLGSHCLNLLIGEKVPPNVLLRFVFLSAQDFVEAVKFLNYNDVIPQKPLGKNVDPNGQVRIPGDNLVLAAKDSIQFAKDKLLLLEERSGSNEPTEIPTESSMPSVEDNFGG